MIGFYAALVGAKVTLAVLVAAGRRHLGDTGYRRTLVAAGVLLCGVGIVLAVQFGRQLA